MLSFPLRRAQIELQSHRNWLRTFAVRSRHGETAFNKNGSVRFFTSSHRHGDGKDQEHEDEQKQERKQEQTRKKWNAIARARYKADAEQWRNNDGEQAAEGSEATAGSRRLSDAQRRKRERWEARRAGPQTYQLKALGLREDLLTAVKENNTAAVFRLYRDLPEKKPLVAEDFRAIAQCTHQALRTENQRPQQLQQSERKQAIVAFAELLVKDIRHGNLVPSKRAHTHLLGIFKESGYLDSGIMFWNWLEPQDDQHVGHETYGAAIELLAIHGTPLEDLESLYSRALARFPGNFSAYHMSPNAMLPDREASTAVKGLPVSLLQAITTARLMRGDSRRAYLALDTVFRLFPTAVESRFIKLFLEERPVSEAYAVFALACRAGLVLPSVVFRTLLPKLRAAAESRSAQHHIASLRAMLTATHLQLGATGKVVPNNVAELIITTTTIFRRPGVDKLEGKQRKRLVDAILLFVRQMFETFARFGVLPTPAALNSILINVAGYGRSKETLGIVLKDFEALKMTQNEVTRRTVLAIAGMWGDQAMIEESWSKIIEARRAKDQWPDPTDFFVLSKSVRATGKVSFAREQFDTLKMFIPQIHHSSIDYAITQAYEPDTDVASGHEQVSFAELYEGIEKLNADLAVLELETRDRPAVQDFSDKHLCLTLLPPEGALKASEAVMRQVYDEMTADPGTRAPVVHDSTTDADVDDRTFGRVVRSATNITLGDLRYETWKNINNLLQLAEKHDVSYNEIVDRCIAEGKRPPKREMGFTQTEMSSMSGIGLSEVAARQKKSEVTVEEYRAEVKRLRGMDSQ